MERVAKLPLFIGVIRLTGVTQQGVKLKSLNDASFYELLAYFGSFYINSKLLPRNLSNQPEI
jgi:hypothetical protein